MPPNLPPLASNSAFESKNLCHITHRGSFYKIEPHSLNHALFVKNFHINRWIIYPSEGAEHLRIMSFVTRWKANSRQLIILDNLNKVIALFHE